MKICRILAISLALLLMATSAYAAVSWDYDWSSSDDGSSFSGSDIEDIQDNISTQCPTLAGDNILTGTNTFSGTATFTGAVTGVDAAKDGITRGLQLEWGTKEQVIIKVGTLYHGTTRVNKTANVHLDITTAAHYITGVSQQTTNDWLYVYVDSSGNTKFDNTAPDKSDTAGDTEGNLIYYYYSTGTTYYRCIGAIRLNATGSGEVSNFFQRNDIVMWDVPVSASTTVSANAWSGAIDCSAAIPAISEMGIFGLMSHDTGSSETAEILIKPYGSTWSTDDENAIHFAGGDTASCKIGGQRQCATDSSQQIQMQNQSGDDNTAVDVEGYLLSIL